MAGKNTVLIIKDCPFCGSSARLGKHETAWVFCCGCDAAEPFEIWNNRVIVDDELTKS